MNCSYLLLIDDVRSEKAWKEISGSLLGLSSKKCIIIVTTRSPAVAAACNEKGSETDRLSTTHKMGSFGTDNSKEIFMEALSESRSGLKDGTNATTNNITPARLWEMCGDQPVAIIAMAAHVAYNLDKPVEEWKQVCSNLLPDSVKAVARDGVPRILRHCYHDMPAEIKTCFLYLSMYPKGCKISRKHLTRRWIAEGFVEEKPGQSMQEVADDYLDQLIRRKMVQPVEQSSNGKVKNCKVYELVHDFIVSMASEENLVTVIVGGSYLVPPSSGKLRRLLSHSIPAENDDAAGQISLNMSHVRSLVVFEDLEGRDHLGSDNVSRSVPQPLTSRDCPILQVLDLEGCRDVHHLDTKQMRLLCNMLLLKYLSLRRTDIVNLPREIGKLSKLESLDIRETEVTVLPHTVWHLERLVTLLGGDKTTRPRKAFKLPANNTKKATTMKSLQVLSGIEITEGSLEHLKDLTKLRKLAIYRLELDNKVESNMEGLKSWIERLGDNYLHTLVIMFADQEQLIEVKHSSFKLLTALEIFGTSRLVVELPDWIKELSVLAKLTLPMTALRSDTLDHLSLMSSLFSLSFALESETIPDKINATIQRNKADSYGEIIVPGDGFIGLKLLRFSAPSMPPLSFLDMAMPNLERLELRCKMLEGLFGIENLKELKEVHLSVHVQADQFTKSLVKNIAAAAEGTRIIRDEYQE